HFVVKAFVMEIKQSISVIIMSSYRRQCNSKWRFPLFVRGGLHLKIVLSGFYGLGNTGDEAILNAIVDNLRSELNNPDITVFSLSPELTAKEHGVKSVYRGWRHQIRKKLKLCVMQTY
ncbi:polysaccharide pyruvyl transferase family protein, partial [Leptospira santarosai]|nr:polysaccharide pyruvyl transferase family protein [Leptospira santarosai]